jgi:GMP synthase (glutamine-hydrolysing)
LFHFIYQLTMKSLFVIKAGSTFDSEVERLGDFETWVERGLGQLSCPVVVIDVVGGEPLPAPLLCAGAVVTGSHAMVTDNLPWSVAIERWIRELIVAGIPYLGICYGHQLLGRAAGGEVGYHPLGREVGTVTIELTEEGQQDPLFDGVPGCFAAHATHAQSVLRLPDGAVRLAFNDFEPNHAFRVGDSVWGVQFHPEYTREIMETYVRDEIADLEVEGKDGTVLRDVVAEAPFAGLVLTNFASFVTRYL